MKIDKITPQIAALYLGQKASLYWDGEFDREGTMVVIQPEDNHTNGLGFITEGFGVLYYRFEDVKLHLRSLESITEEECRELVLAFTGEPFPDVNWTAKNWWLSIQKTSSFNLIASTGILLILLSKGFDLFDLIPSGLAKESTP